MTIDMSQFYQVFFEESAELLEEMEHLLLELDVQDPGKDALNAIFRTAHSIKGGSATFGFNEITETTHILESLLDKLRNDELQLRIEMVDVFLKAVDVIKVQLAGRQFESEVDAEVVAAICLRLNQLAQGTPAPAVVAPPAAVAAPAPAPAPVPQPSTQPLAQGSEMVDPTLENLYAILTETAVVPEPASSANPAGTEVAQPYGFYAELPAVGGPEKAAETPELAESAAEAAPTRRATDPPGVEKRRANDRPDNEATSIRVGVEKVDQLINLVGELVITQAMLAQTASRVDTALYESLRTGLGQLEHNPRDLQESVMSIRMMPISFVFSRFPRVVRDLAGTLEQQGSTLFIPMHRLKPSTGSSLSVRHLPMTSASNGFSAGAAGGITVPGFPATC